MPGTSASLDREWSVLTEACSTTPDHEKLSHLRSLLQQPVRWKSLLDLADRHGVQPLLYQALLRMEDEDAVPVAEMRSLKQSYETNLHKALLLSRELIRIVENLTASGMEAMPYKGVALAELLYRDVASRPSGDIDLLIQPQDLPRIREAVGTLGYTPHLTLSDPEEAAYLKSGYEYGFDGPAGPNLLELQWAIQPRFYAVNFDMEGLFQRAVTIPVASYPMKTPSPADLFLVLSVHAAKHVWGRLVWLCDIARLMSREDLDWEWIGSQAKALGVVRILWVTMLAANRLLRTVIPAAAQKSIPTDPAAPAVLEEIQASFLSEQGFDTESLAYFRLMMRLRERSTDRLRFLHRLMLTPGPGEWKVGRLPRPLFPLYRAVRLSRLAVRLIRR